MLKQKRQLGGQAEALGVHGAESGNLRLVLLETGSCYAALMARFAITPGWPGASPSAGIQSFHYHARLEVAFLGKRSWA